jgi:hypothetical protein
MENIPMLYSYIVPYNKFLIVYKSIILWSKNIFSNVVMTALVEFSKWLLSMSIKIKPIENIFNVKKDREKILTKYIKHI